MLLFQGFRFAIGQDSGLNRRHAELVIRELAKFHAISYCMKKGSNDSLLNAYTYLAEDSLYRSGYQICSTFNTQWSKWPKFVSLHYWHAPREKTVKTEQKLSKKPCFLKVFQILFNLGWILALQLIRVDFRLVVWIFWHPWGRINSGVKRILVT